MDKRDIANVKEVQMLVDTFYGHIQQDDLIGPIFNSVIKDWSPHLQKMYRFWQTVLLEEHTYSGSPFPLHYKLNLEQKHFDRWLRLWKDTVHDLFEGEKATEAIWRAEKMAVMFMSKINYFNNNNIIPLM